MNCGHCNGISSALRNSFSLSEDHPNRSDNQHAENSLSVLAALEMIFEGPILQEGNKYQHDHNDDTELKLCGKCVQSLCALIKTYQEFLKLREDLSETTKLFCRIDIRSRKPRKVQIHSSCSAVNRTDTSISEDFELLQIPVSTIKDNENDSTNIRNQTRTTRATSRKKLNSSASASKNSKELVVRLERCDDLLGPDGKVKSEDEDETKPEVIFECDFLVVPSSSEEEGSNHNSLENSEGDNSENMDFDNNDEITKKSSPRLDVQEGTFQSASALRNQSLGFQCLLCPEKLPTTKTFLEHTTQTHPEQIKSRKPFFADLVKNNGDYECTLCELTYSSDANLATHIRRFHLRVNEYKCSIESCGKVLKSEAGLATHMRQVHNCRKPINAIKCPSCHAELNTLKSFMKHVTEQHPEQIKSPKLENKGSEGKWKCTICNLNYSSNKALNLHIRHFHLRAKVIRKCPVESCGSKVFKRLVSLNNHIKKFHRNEEPKPNKVKKIKCPSCQADVDGLTAFMDHIAEVHPNLTTRRKLGLQQDTKNIGDYQCKLCDRRYSHKHSLIEHLEIYHLNFARFKCLFQGCERGFSRNEPFQRHLKFHDKKVVERLEVQKLTPFACTFGNCLKSFSTKRSLKIHIGLNHKQKRLICPSCPENFEAANSFMDHVTQHHPQLVIPILNVNVPNVDNDQKSKCLLCHQLYPKLKAHLRYVHAKKTFKCPREGCKLSFSGEYKMETHISNVHDGNVEKLICELCGGEFLNRGNFNRHLRTSKLHNPTANVVFKCREPECSKEFRRLDYFHGHLETAHGNFQHRYRNPPQNSTRMKSERSKCPSCIEEFPCLYYLELHVRTKHKDEAGLKIYGCKHSGCDKRFGTLLHLQCHQRNTHGGFKYACTYPNCNMGYKKKWKIKMHLKTHERSGNTLHCTKKRTAVPAGHRTVHPQTCSFPGCGRKYLYRKNLLRHANQAHGPPKHKPPEMQCDKCEKMFSTRQNLQKHLQTHEVNRERKYLCDKCPKKFTNSDGLSQHVRFVHGVKPLKPCSFPGCGRSFSACNFKKHMQTHDAKREPKYPCDICNKIFLNSGGVWQHKRFVHDKKPWPKNKKKKSPQVNQEETLE